LGGPSHAGCYQPPPPPPPPPPPEDPPPPPPELEPGGVEEEAIAPANESLNALVESAIEEAKPEESMDLKDGPTYQLGW